MPQGPPKRLPYTPFAAPMASKSIHVRPFGAFSEQNEANMSFHPRHLKLKGNFIREIASFNEVSLTKTQAKRSEKREERRQKRTRSEKGDERGERKEERREEKRREERREKREERREKREGRSREERGEKREEGRGKREERREGKLMFILDV